MWALLALYGDLGGGDGVAGFAGMVDDSGFEDEGIYLSLWRLVEGSVLKDILQFHLISGGVRRYRLHEGIDAFRTNGEGDLVEADADEDEAVESRTGIGNFESGIEILAEPDIRIDGLELDRRLTAFIAFAAGNVDSCGGEE